MCKKIYRHLAKEVAKEMVVQLAANQHKGDREVWVNMNVETLIDEIHYHTNKLASAVALKDKLHIKEYAADIANLAGMVMDKMKVIDLDSIDPDQSRGKRKNINPQDISS
jgi:hypothetical protein